MNKITIQLPNDEFAAFLLKRFPKMFPISEEELARAMLEVGVPGFWPERLDDKLMFLEDTTCRLASKLACTHLCNDATKEDVDNALRKLWVEHTGREIPEPDDFTAGNYQEALRMAAELAQILKHALQKNASKFQS